jgi:hypothetical protein
MIKPLLLIAGLLGAAMPALLAQSKPAAQPFTRPAAGTSQEAHARQYFADLSQRQREIYFAPSDGRAIALISTTITEFTARKKGLLAEAAPLQDKPAAQYTGKLPRQSPTWPQEQQALLTSAAGAKMAARRQRNPALEAAFRRFEAAQLTSLSVPTTLPQE